MISNMLNNLSYELLDLKRKAEEDQKREERWKIAQAQGCSYQEWLDQEEVTRQSEEYERLMGIQDGIIMLQHYNRCAGWHCVTSCENG